MRKLAALSWCVVLVSPGGGAQADVGLDCSLETPLSRAAAELLARGEPPSAEALTRAVRASGSDVVGPHALFTTTDDAPRQRAWLRDIAQRADAPTVCGHAAGEHGVLLVAAPRGGSLEPLTASSTRVRGTLAPGFSRPEVVASDAHDELVRVRVDPVELARGIPISEALLRPARVQLIAHGPAGPRPVAERVLPAVDTPSPDDDFRPIETAPGTPIVDQLDALRATDGTKQLVPNRLVDDIARAHAANVCTTGRVAHTLDARDPETRFETAGLRARLVGEAVARAGSADAAFRAMQQSPSHRMTLLDARFTHVGIGHAHDRRGHTCLVVMLAAWPRFVGK